MNKNRQGMTAIAIILIIVAAILSIGLGAGIRYYQDKLSKNNNIRNTTSTKNSVVVSPQGTTSITQSSTTSAPTSSQNAQLKTTTINCANSDFNCIIAAVQNCAPASMEWTTSIGYLITQAKLSLKGLNSDGKCSFSEYTVNASFDETQLKQADKAQGMTDAQIQQQLQTALTQFNYIKQQVIGTTIDCTISTSSLAKAFTNWSKGTLSTDDLSSGNCTQTLPNGTKTQLYNGGGSGPLTQIASTDVYLYPNYDTTLNGVEFKVNYLTTNQLNLTVTDHNTGKSQTVLMVPGDSTNVAGHTMTLTSIKNVSVGTTNGQPTYSLQAIVNYQ